MCDIFRINLVKVMNAEDRKGNRLAMLGAYGSGRATSD